MKPFHSAFGKALVLLLVAMTSAVFAQTDLPADRPGIPSADEVREIVAPALDGKWATGLVIGVYQDGETRVYAFGSLAEDADPARLVFEIGSVTKVFTGLLLADAVVLGKLRLEDPLSDHVAFKVPSFEGQPVRLVHLATHTSALPAVPDDFLTRKHDPTNPYGSYSFDEMVAFVEAYKLPRAPGTQFEYSNIGMGLVGHVLETKVYETDLDTAFAARICVPLEMNDTRIVLTEPLRKRLVQGHTATLEPTGTWDIPAMPGCGALKSTVADMLRFIRAELDPGGTHLEEAIRLSQQEHFQGPGGGNGLGWLIGKKGDMTILNHAGQTGGYTSFLGIVPERKAGVIVLADAAGCVAIGVGTEVFRRLVTGTRAPSCLPVPVVLAEAELDRFTGAYAFPGGTSLRILREGSRLLLETAEGTRVAIEPCSPARFFVRESPILPLFFEFRLGEDGRVKELVAESDGESSPEVGQRSGD
ncbi:MAG: serine hydrolase [Planctomycetes bacterium]|nr:serine hydrolase [Planctomycetota bacterium]